MAIVVRPRAARSIAVCTQVPFPSLVRKLLHLTIYMFAAYVSKDCNKTG